MTSLTRSVRDWRHKTFASLGYPAFRLYWFSQIISLVGTWLQNTAQSYLVLEMSGSSALLGWVSAVFFLPSLLFSILAGTLLDHVHRGKLLQWTQVMLLATALITGILVQTEHISLPLIFVMAFLTGLANAFNMPARQTMAATFVPREGLPNALALNNLSFNLSRTLGQALFGVVVPLGIWLFSSLHLSGFSSTSLSRLALPFYLNALAFAVTIGLQFALPIKAPAADPHKKDLWQDTLEGFRYVRNDAQLPYILLLVAGISIFLLNFQVLIPSVAKQLYHLNETGFGVFNALFGVGSVAGALFQASQPDPRQSLRKASLLLPISLLIFAFTPNIYAAGLALMICGTLTMMVLISANSSVQMALEEQFRGRVMSIYTLVLVGVAPIGAVLSGWLVSSGLGLGLRWGTAVLAILGATCVLALWKKLPSGKARKN